MSKPFGQYLRWGVYAMLSVAAGACGGQGAGGPSVREQLAHFAQQAHRFEFRGYDLYYNGAPVLLDRGLAYYQARFGRDTVWADGYGDVLRMSGAPITLNKGMDDVVDGLTIELYYRDEAVLMDKSRGDRWAYPPTVLGEDYVLVDGVPLNKDSDMAAVNELLVKLDRKPFTKSIAGQSFIARTKVTFENGYEEEILVWPGDISELYMIQYADNNTRSK